jgi:hypothetical protein
MKNKRYKRYVVLHSKHRWFWMGERWTYIKCAASTYTKATLPEKIRNSVLERVDENNVETWKYIDGKETLAKVVRENGY